MHTFCFELLIKHKHFLVHFSSYQKSNDYEEIKKIYLEEEEKIYKVSTDESVNH